MAMYNVAAVCMVACLITGCFAAEKICTISCKCVKKVMEHLDSDVPLAGITNFHEVCIALQEAYDCIQTDEACGDMRRRDIIVKLDKDFRDLFCMRPNYVNKPALFYNYDEYYYYYYADNYKVKTKKHCEKEAKEAEKRKNAGSDLVTGTTLGTFVASLVLAATLVN